MAKSGIISEKEKQQMAEKILFLLQEAILSIIQDGREKGYEADTILQSIEAELTVKKYD